MSFPMGRRGTLLIVAAAAGLAIAAYLFITPREKTVAAIVVASAPAERVLAVNGRIRPRLQIDVRAPMGGELVELPFDVGDRVAQGQTIARLDDAPESAAIEEAEAAAQAQAAVLAQARRDLARYEALGEFSPRRDVEQRRLAVEEGVRELSRRRATAVQARAQRGRRVLEAPFDGVILERLVDPGQTVGADTVIYRLADLSRPQITAEIDEIYAAEIKPGMEALVSFPGARENMRATVLHVEPRVDPSTGARDVRLEMPDAISGAAAGLTVTINVIVERRAQALSIPRQTILDAAVNPRVRIVDAAGAVSERKISFIDWPAVNVIVTSGLSGGERVLLNPAAAQIGEKVRIAP
jgi:HlyD family secretion protein